jgi:predicted esterase
VKLAGVLLVGGCAPVTSSPTPTAPTPQRAVRCLGPTNAKSFAVYLHGIDTSAISDQEAKNRETLARIADSLSMRIALPRASMPCPNQSSSLCWGWAFDEREVDAAVPAIDSAARECFGDRPFGLIGFSNGGYLLTKLLRACVVHDKLPKATWLVTVGSAVFKGALEPRPESLASCGHMVVLAGTADPYNFDPTDHLVELLKAKGADVTAVRFDGGHEVPDPPLRQVLEGMTGLSRP